MESKVIKINLWGDRVLVEVLKEPATTASGIYVPEKKAGDDGVTHRAKVVKISKAFTKKADPELEKLELGDVVLISQFAGSDAKIGLDEYKVLRATDIIGVLEE